MGAGIMSPGLELPLRRLCSQQLTANRYHLSHVPDPVAPTSPPVATPSRPYLSRHPSPEAATRHPKRCLSPLYSILDTPYSHIVWSTEPLSLRASSLYRFIPCPLVTMPTCPLAQARVPVSPCQHVTCWAHHASMSAPCLTCTSTHLTFPTSSPHNLATAIRYRSIWP